MTKAEIAREYVQSFPDISKSALARLMFAENNVLFKDVEDARYSLRYVTGANGENNRSKIPESDIKQGVSHPTNPYGLPISDESKWEPHILQSEKYLVLYFVE